MNKKNLILLGAICQKKFDMRDDFKIMEISSDPVLKYRTAIPEMDFIQRHPYPSGEYDEVELVKFASEDNFESVRVGYSARANVLLIQEAG